MSGFARGKYAIGYCERCQFKVPLGKLRNQVVAAKPTGLMVCPDCLDKDHPQLLLGRYRIHDPQALRRPAPPSEVNLPNLTDGLLDIGFVLDESELA